MQWVITPTEFKLIPNIEGHFLVTADIIDQDENVTKGFINLITPERVADYVIYDLNNPKFSGVYELKNKDIIPSVASDCFGTYELYYSKNNPEIGLDILREVY